MGAWLGSALGFAWGASAGFGFGLIFEQQRATKRIVAYWGMTLAVIGIFFGMVFLAAPEESPAHLAKSAAFGAICGAVLGLPIGAMHMTQLRRKSQGQSP